MSPHAARRRWRIQLTTELVKIVGIVALVLGVWATSVQGRNLVVASQRVGCMRGTADRVSDARRAAADALRESRLANVAGEPAHLEHARSATIDGAAARDYLSRSGVPNGWDLETITTLQPDDPDVLGMRVAYCEHAYPNPGWLAFRP